MVYKTLQSLIFYDNKMLVLNKLSRYIIIYNNVLEPKLLKKTYINDISVGFMIKQYMLDIYLNEPLVKYKVLLYCGRNNIAMKFCIRTEKNRQIISICTFLCQYKIKFNISFLQYKAIKNNQLYDIHQSNHYDKNIYNYFIEYYRDNIKKLKF